MGETTLLLPHVMVTAHRKLTRRQIQWLNEHDVLMRVISKLQAEHGMEWAISGMALGGDQIWAELAKVCGARLHAVIPFTEQPAKWTEAQIARYEELLALADLITDAGKGRNPRNPRQAAAMLHARNDAMLNISAGVVAVWDRTNTRGGTWSAVCKAVERELPIIWLDPRAETVKMPTQAAWARILSTSSD